jgi:general secretion pathway protein I
MSVINHNGGFSLIEVMIAILILGIALVGLTHGITTALGSSKDSELQTTAALFAQGRMETIRAEDGITDGEDEGDCGAALPLYRWKQTIAKSDVDGLHDVEVTVENAQTGQEIYSLRTLLFEPPDDSTTNESGKGKDSKSKKRSGGT